MGWLIWVAFEAGGSGQKDGDWGTAGWTMAAGGGVGRWGVAQCLGWWAVASGSVWMRGGCAGPRVLTSSCGAGQLFFLCWALTAGWWPLCAPAHDCGVGARLGGKKKQDMVLVPAASGVMGILPRHAPTVAQLRPGVVEVHTGGAKEKYFVSSGFAFVHKDRTDVCAVAAAPVRGDWECSAGREVQQGGGGCRVGGRRVGKRGDAGRATRRCLVGVSVGVWMGVDGCVWV